MRTLRSTSNGCCLAEEGAIRPRGADVRRAEAENLTAQADHAPARARAGIAWSCLVGARQVRRTNDVSAPAVVPLDGRGTSTPGASPRREQQDQPMIFRSLRRASRSGLDGSTMWLPSGRTTTGID